MTRPATPDDVDEIRGALAGIVTDAWATRAPKRLARAHLGDG